MPQSHGLHMLGLAQSPSTHLLLPCPHLQVSALSTRPERSVGSSRQTAVIDPSLRVAGLQTSHPKTSLGP